MNEYYDYPTDGAAVTPADGANLPKAGILNIGTAGTVRCLLVSGNEVTLTLPVGTSRIPVIKVFSTGTTAANITVLYAK